MSLVEITVKNYKSYLDLQTVKVAPGFNVFLGGNNSGKTTLLEALDVSYGSNVPHRSLKNLPDFGLQPMGFSAMSLSIQTTLRELRDPTSRSAIIPIPNDWRNNLRTGDYSTEAIQRFIDNQVIEIQVEFGGVPTTLAFKSALGAMKILPNGRYTTMELAVQDDSSLSYTTLHENTGGARPDLLQALKRITNSFYRFSPNRRPASSCGESPHPVALSPDASNLAYCLNHLSTTDAHGFETLCEWVNRVFPAVHWIQASPRQGNLFEVECLPTSRQTRRNDLAVSLGQMGTGIGNVIAMLYVVLTARSPRVIAVDEPNSFLHPKALRELLQIFASEGKDHQFILTAHSADVLTAVPPSLITLFELIDGATSTRQESGGCLAEIREGLSDLGIRMTDLHGRDKVLWVEGQTEELVLPQLLQHFCPEIAPGTAVLRVEHTGTFEKKGVDASEVASLYQRLSHSTALVPPMVAILLDREKRKPTECKRLERESKGVLKFLERSMIENYVLDVDAVSSLLSHHGESVSPAQLASYLEQDGKPINLASVDGAKILARIFDDLTEARTSFKKTRDVPLLISWLLEHKRAHLDPLKKYLRSIFLLAA